MKSQSYKLLAIPLIILMVVSVAVGFRATAAFYLGNTDFSIQSLSASSAASNLYLTTGGVIVNKSTASVSVERFAALESQIKTYLGSNLGNYTVYLQDLNTAQTMAINAQVIITPASIAKMPIAILVMRDIDAGKYTLDSTYPMYDSEKFSFIGDLGPLPDGTPVTIRTYLEELLEQSDNNAWYALTYFLGDLYDVVNPRIVNELGVSPFFLDPHDTTAANVGKVMADLYNAKTLSAHSRDYLLSLLEQADDDLKIGIGSGLPTGIKFANKVGFLDTDTELSYQDAAIVWGPKTNYVLVVLDHDQDWDTAIERLTAISQKVYSFIEN